MIELKRPSPLRKYRDLPDWPALLSLDLAAAFVSLSTTAFEARVGTDFPEPIRLGSRKLWHKEVLQRAIDRLNDHTDADVGQPAESIGDLIAAHRQHRKRPSP
ncbi:MAG: hypothetical protein OXM58_13305 [Rhodospirillaceae bacterium]|nr:hypothetical protein [Rhodospirillaceae bacterium]MDE0615999.1 hypothetical protein [Rhodospirillaceae bacterium]